ncbi:hypothetical protein PENSTE_c052G00782 [Penicillium steckii]|uniref:FAD-binding PCMH-type domain-containing protein n=1 Tax=Penicillium steckii TaxID=303698 RepID=A0A1V6SIL3_9EURO|nr:hypothetical protein PENSTE_c052G00782 [Penicillium steckii]
MSSGPKLVSDPPTLDGCHSGIPRNLLRSAAQVKANLVSNQTIDPRERAQLPVLPQGFTSSQFATALAEIIHYLGKQHVEINDKPLDDGWYIEHPNTHDAFNLFDSEDTVSSAAVYPGSVEDVQAIVRWANKFRMPIFPISIGRNFGYGGAAPRVRGSVVIDLGRRMNRILDINPDDCTCLVEPGVTFYALYEEIQKRGYKHLWIDVPDLGGGSVIGNTLDRGVGYTPYGDHFAMHSGMEVVLPRGHLVRTGMGALPGNNTWQTFPYGFGPYYDGIFTQSNFGIVTKMGMTLMPNPGGHESFMYTFEKEEDLPQIVEAIRPLRIGNILENVAQLKHVVQEVAALGKPRASCIHPGEALTDGIRRIATSLPYGDCTWIYYGTCYGPAELRNPKLKIIHAAFTRIPGARKIDPQTLPPDHYFWSRDRICSGVPDIRELSWLNWQPNGAHVFFSPICPIKGQDAERLLAIAGKWHNKYNLDIFPAFCVGAREMHLIINIVYDRGCEISRQNAYRCMRGMIQEAAGYGYGEYRTHLLFQDQVAATYNWKNGALMNLHNSIKDTLDPNGILAPGRLGIWPAAYRNRGWELTHNDTNTSGKALSEGNSVCHSRCASDTKL